MTTTPDNRQRLIAETYTKMCSCVSAYMSARIKCSADAENAAQDVWLHLMEYDRPLDAATLPKLVWTITARTAADYLRRLYSRRAVMADWDEMTDMPSGVTACDHIIARELMLMEQCVVRALPEQRRIIYVMSRFEERTVAEISEEMNLSTRTVENHLRMGRRDIRQAISASA